MIFDNLINNIFVGNGTSKANEIKGNITVDVNNNFHFQFFTTSSYTLKNEVAKPPRFIFNYTGYAAFFVSA